MRSRVEIVGCLLCPAAITERHPSLTPSHNASRMGIPLSRVERGEHLRLPFGLCGGLGKLAKRCFVGGHPSGFLARTRHDETGFHDGGCVSLLDSEDDFALRLPGEARPSGRERFQQCLACLQRSSGADDGVDKRAVLPDRTGEVVRTQRQVAKDDVDKGLRRGGEFDMDAGKFLGYGCLELGAQGLRGDALIDGHETLLWLDFRAHCREVDSDNSVRLVKLALSTHALEILWPSPFAAAPLVPIITAISLPRSSKLHWLCSMRSRIGTSPCARWLGARASATTRLTNTFRKNATFWLPWRRAALRRWPNTCFPRSMG